MRGAKNIQDLVSLAKTLIQFPPTLSDLLGEGLLTTLYCRSMFLVHSLWGAELCLHCYCLGKFNLPQAVSEELGSHLGKKTSAPILGFVFPPVSVFLVFWFLCLCLCFLMYPLHVVLQCNVQKFLLSTYSSPGLPHG